MAINRDKPDKWKEDIILSVDMYNDWFMNFAPKAFRETRIQTTEDVKKTLAITANFTDVSSKTLKEHPCILPTLRMATCPPLAADRLIGLAGVSKNLVKRMEAQKKIPVRMNAAELEENLNSISDIIKKMAD